MGTERAKRKRELEGMRYKGTRWGTITPGKRPVPEYLFAAYYHLSLERGRSLKKKKENRGKGLNQKTGNKKTLRERRA